MTGAARLREALEIAHGALNYAVEDHHWDGAECLCDAAVVTLRAARDAASEALAAVPEAPEPVYVYRAASECIKWYHRETASEARADLPEVADEPAARWIERRGPWERVEEGTE